MQQLVILIIMLLSSIMMSQSSGDTIGQNIIVNMTNFDSNDGKVLVGLYDSEANWLSKRIKGDIATLENKTCKVVFKNVPAGTYAISIFHDENDNNKLDTNFLGIPKEDTGSSNNAPARFGPPKWKDAKFEVKDKTITQNIKL